MAIVPGGAGARRRLVVRQRLRERRRDLGLTQKQVVSRLARLGMLTTNKALSSLEHGTGLDVAKLPELARALECTITYLLGLTSDPSRWEPDPRPAPQRPTSAVTPVRQEPRAPVREQGVREQAERERSARDQAVREQAERERLAREQAVREQAERERLAREQAVREQAERERLAREQAEREQAERERTLREESERDSSADERSSTREPIREPSSV
jgi:transcriptional regulator with XRE-family HTH domain